MTNETNIDKAKSEKESSKIVNLFNEKRQSSPSTLESINLINHKYVSVRTTNGKQIAHLDMSKDDSSKAKLEKLFSQLRTMCIRDANYWVELPTGSWIRKNAILGFECADGAHQGVILRAHNNRILSFIPCVGGLKLNFALSKRSSWQLSKKHHPDAISQHGIFTKNKRHSIAF